MAEKRFEKIYYNGGGFSGPATTVLVDKETGVNYLFVQNGNGAGLTPLLNRDGTVVVTPTSQFRQE
ncbi:MAG: xylan 1,4-beta-xylosidase [Clostridia bacterium]|nr:xylan 1,4-beta-xylosidase [Clostridia bacterium]